MSGKIVTGIWAVAGVLLGHCTADSGLATNSAVLPSGGSSQTGGTTPLGGGTPAMGGGVSWTGGSAVATGGSAVATGGSAVATGGSAVATGGVAIVTGGSPLAPPAGGPTSAEGYMNLAPPLGETLTADNGTPLDPPAPTGWTFYQVDGTFCRDGSAAGMFVRHTDSDKLLIYYEGGGACTTKGFCHFNPQSLNHVLSGTGESVLGTALAVVPGRQQPGVYENGAMKGIFDESNAANPFKGWNMAYIPYCTGDVHAGTNAAAQVPGVPEAQKMVGYRNSQKFVGRLAATFKDRITGGVATGASAGSFGAALNISMIQDTFAGVPFDAILDSGMPFKDDVWPVCMQKSWRDLFGLNAAFPPDCTQCFQEDGGGILGMADFLINKHPRSSIAAISGVHDEVIRLFFTPGEDNCALIDTADPFELTLGQIAGGQLYATEKYQQGLLEVRDAYVDTGRFATYYMGGAAAALHQHTFRQRFYEVSAGSETPADFVTAFLSGDMHQVGP